MWPGGVNRFTCGNRHPNQSSGEEKEDEHHHKRSHHSQSIVESVHTYQLVRFPCVCVREREGLTCSGAKH